MSTLSSSGRAAARCLALGAALAGLMAGCQALGGGGGVMPASDVGLPPSLRGSLPNREPRNAAAADADGPPPQTTPTKQLAIPRTAGGATQSANAGERRIRREDIEGGNASGGAGGNSMGPMLSPGGSVGLGGKF